MMLTGSFSSDTREILVAADRDGLRQLEDLFNAQKGLIDLDSSETARDLIPLERLSVEPVESHRSLTIHVIPAEHRLEFIGDAENLEVLRDDMRTLAESDTDGEHFHYDYYPGHSYLAADSWPLVVTFRTQRTSMGSV